MSLGLWFDLMNKSMANVDMVSVDLLDLRPSNLFQYGQRHHGL